MGKPRIIILQVNPRKWLEWGKDHSVEERAQIADAMSLAAERGDLEFLRSLPFVDGIRFAEESNGQETQTPEN